MPLTLGQAALAYARKGLAVLPCRPCSKLPVTEHGCLDATTDIAVITEWWRQCPSINVAIATGTPSGIFAVDVDGLDGESSLHELVEEHGPLPPTVEGLTPRPGRHILLAMPATPLSNSAGKLGVGLDIRATGGYVIVPPSIHPNGGRYCWSVDSANTFADAPQWLLAKITEQPNNGITGTPPSVWRDLIDGVTEGQRNQSAARLAGYFLRHHIDAVVTLRVLEWWNSCNTPPLPESEIERVVISVAKRELRRRQP